MEAKITQDFDVAVVGGGPVGLTAAIAFADIGIRTALIARRAAYADNRTTALLGRSTELLGRLDVWRRCEQDAAALATMRLIDDTGRLIRAPEITFSSDDIGLDAFGYNIANRNLVQALEARAAELPSLERFDDDAVDVTPGDQSVGVVTKSGDHLSAQLLAAADGRQSRCRDAAGITMSRRSLGQCALTFNIKHSGPHRNISTEFHTPRGPCVFVPLPGDRSSVVWVTTAAEAGRLNGLDADTFSDAVERQSHAILGKVTADPERHVFPLALEQAERFGGQRIALIGEAAHVLPPIGAQGLNLGLRDVEDLVATVLNCRDEGRDPGEPRALRQFSMARRADVASRSFVIDVANRSLISDFLPLQAVRAAGMHALGAFAPLRQLAMREGLGPSWRRPSLF